MPHISWKTAMMRLNWAMLNSVVLTTGWTNSPSVILMPMVISRMNAAAVMVSQNLGVFDAVCVIMCILSRLSLRIL
ncbi:TPA: hypothetical protein ACRHN5_RS10175 [Neisseria meningitidis]